MSDAQIFRVNLTRAWSRVKTIGACIYCDDFERPLSREHVIPKGLGGGLILRDASCEKCRRITHKFEEACLRGTMLAYRSAFGLVSRPRELPTLSGSLIDQNFDLLGEPFAATPRHLLLPEFASQAAVLHSTGMTTDFKYDVRLFASRMDIDDVIARRGAPFGLHVSFDLVAYLRMIAKIAHGLVVFDLGLDGFTPFLRDFIKTGAAHSLPYYFGAPEWDPPGINLTKLSHDIGWRVVQRPNAEFVVCQVRLFATHGTPPVTVVVGTTSLSDAELLKRARGLEGDA